MDNTEILKKEKKRSKQMENYFLKIFKEFDLDSSGGVSKNQIIKVLQACEIEMDEQQAEDIINQIDADGGGQVEQDQFIAFLKRQEFADQYTEDELRKLFTFFLEGGKQKIGFDQLRKMFENLGEKVTESDISAMILFADKNKDGQIDFEQFCEVITNL